MSTAPLDPAADLENLLRGLATLAEDSAPSGQELRGAEPAAVASPWRSPARDDELPGGRITDPAAKADERFFPKAPRDQEETGVTEAEIQSIILRLLMHRGTAAGVQISQHVGLPFPLTEKSLHELKSQRLLAVRNSAILSDYVYEITDIGMQRARESAETCGYCGTVPVSLAAYTASVAAQALDRTRPRADSLRRAFSDLTINPKMVSRLGRAITAGCGLFLHGAPGNGKTSIAERITAAYGTSIWIPRAISIWGEIVRVFDPSCHEELPIVTGERLIDEDQLDHRWVRIRRPTIVVGGELTMDSLEITLNKDTGVGEAPLQMKSNCGTLVIDDFGRQRISPTVLLNRWIVPLQERHDYLGMASGRKIRVPFEQLIVFATNLEPRDLVDEAFLRRIPYKIEVEDPSQEQFRGLFEQTCREQDVSFDAAALEHLISRHYEAASRPMRFCHPRDLVHQINIFCRFRRIPAAMSCAAIDAAATDYFSVMGL